jgi:hypothetical protein
MRYGEECNEYSACNVVENKGSKVALQRSMEHWSCKQSELGNVPVSRRPVSLVF